MTPSPVKLTVNVKCQTYPPWLVSTYMSPCRNKLSQTPGKKPTLLELSMEQITFCYRTVSSQKDPNLQPHKSFLYWNAHCAELRCELHRCACFHIQKLLITLTGRTKVTGNHRALWRQQGCPSDSFLFCFYYTLRARNFHFPSKPPMDYILRSHSTSR